MNNKVIELAQELIKKPSITPHDEGCQTILINRLEKLGFQIELLPFDNVNNFYAKKGTEGPIFLFAGHTDVVPTGPLDRWTSPPFEPQIRDGLLYGRGAADMKGGLAAMICGVENFLEQHPHHSGSIAFLVTGDEEGIAINGTKKVVDNLIARDEKITWCLVGEASCEQHFGDCIKIGRRGSLTGTMTIYGKQGHIAYPHKADNPLHRSLSALNELTTTIWDQGNDYFPATSFQISNLKGGTGADNVIPDRLEVVFNFRYSPAITAEQLQAKVAAIMNKHQLKYDIHWRHSGEPFLTEPNNMLTATTQAINEITMQQPKLSTDGGTSDGRFIAKMGCQVMEFGVCNQSIHQIDESVNIKDLQNLTRVYSRILELLLLN